MEHFSTYHLSIVSDCFTAIEFIFLFPHTSHLFLIRCYSLCLSWNLFQCKDSIILIWLTLPLALYVLFNQPQCVLSVLLTRASFILCITDLAFFLPCTGFNSWYLLKVFWIKNCLAYSCFQVFADKLSSFCYLLAVM